MGFESFLVELRGGRSTYRDSAEAVRQLPQVSLDPHALPTKGSTFYLFDDGQHVIEMELMDAPVRLSCRFTLCHPTSVDAAFLGLAHGLLVRLGMEIGICDDVPAEQPHSFSLSDFSEFAAIATRCIAARRKEWIANFGAEPLAAATNEVYQRIILPRCQPGIAQPT